MKEALLCCWDPARVTTLVQYFVIYTDRPCFVLVIDLFDTCFEYNVQTKTFDYQMQGSI